MLYPPVILAPLVGCTNEHKVHKKRELCVTRYSAVDSPRLESLYGNNLMYSNYCHIRYTDLVGVVSGSK